MSANTPGASEVPLATITSLESRAWVRKLVAAAIVGAILGAIIGGFAFQLLRPDATAIAFVRINQPVDLVALAGGSSQTTPNTQDNLEHYAAGEVVFLSSQGFSQAVGQKLGLSKPAEFKVMRDGDTTVVSITSTSPVANSAIRTVQTAIDLYKEQLSQRADQQMRLILPALAQWELGAVVPDRVQQIQGLRDRLQLQSNPSSTLTVLQSPTLSDTGGHRTLVGVALGACLLGALFPLILVGRRRSRGRLSLDPQIIDTVDGLLIPAVDLRQQQGDAASGERASMARTLYGQLPSAGPHRIVVLIGSSPESGTDEVASLFEFAASEDGAVETIKLAGGHVDSLALDAGDTSFIVDAGTVGDSALTSRAIRAATDLVIVTRLGVDTMAQAMTIRSMTASADAPLVAVFTHRPWWSGRAKSNKEEPAVRVQSEPPE